MGWWSIGVMVLDLGVVCRIWQIICCGGVPYAAMYGLRSWSLFTSTSLYWLKGDAVNAIYVRVEKIRRERIRERDFGGISCRYVVDRVGREIATIAMIRGVHNVYGHIVEQNIDVPGFGVVEPGPEAQPVGYVGHYSHWRADESNRYPALRAA